MATHASHQLTEIKDKGIILYRRIIREDDILLHVLTKTHGHITAYAHKAAISKRRFPNCCEVFRHVQLHAKKTKSDFWTLEEMSTLNYFKNLSRHYPSYMVASRALSLIRKISPPEHPAENLYVLLGGFLQYLTTTREPELAWVPFELKVLQAAGLFSMNLVHKTLADFGLTLTDQELALIQTLLQSQSQRWIFSRPQEEVAILKKLEIQTRRIREDYNLKP